MKESVKIEKSVLDKVRRHTKKTRQTIGGFFELSATSEINGYKTVSEWKKKAEMWDQLSSKITNFYTNSRDENEEVDLLDIGEAAATAFGFL